MLVVLADNWGLMLLRGIFGILFGLIALFMPGPTLAVLVIVFGAYAFVDGVLALILAINGRRERGFGALLIEGVFGIGAGVVSFFYPGITALVLLAVIATWAIFTGVLAIVSAITLRKEITGEWMLATSGLLSIIFGVLLIVWASASRAVPAPAFSSTAA